MIRLNKHKEPAIRKQMTEQLSKTMALQTLSIIRLNKQEEPGTGNRQSGNKSREQDSGTQDNRESDRSYLTLTDILPLRAFTHVSQYLT